MVTTGSEVYKGDAIWAPYRRHPLWPALVKNTYPKKVTFTFFPLSALEFSNDVAKKVAVFSCHPKSVRPFTVNDVLPSHSSDDLKKAFNAARLYLNERKTESEISNVSEKPSTSENIKKANSGNKVIEEINENLTAVKQKEKKVAFKRRIDKEKNAQPEKKQAVAPPVPAFAADSTTHPENPHSELLACAVFREAHSVLERLWTTDLVQRYVPPRRSVFTARTYTGGFLTDHETDSLFEMIFNWVRDREKGTYLLPGVHLVLEVLMPEIIIQAIVQSCGISREAAEKIVRGRLPTNTANNKSGGQTTSGHPSASSNGSLEELARVACKERETITE